MHAESKNSSGPVTVEQLELSQIIEMYSVNIVDPLLGVPNPSVLPQGNG
jgi:hypothetical protein